MDPKKPLSVPIFKGISLSLKGLLWSILMVIVAAGVYTAWQLTNDDDTGQTVETIDQKAPSETTDTTLRPTEDQTGNQEEDEVSDDPVVEETPVSTEDQVMYPDADAMTELAILAKAGHICEFDTQTEECAYIVDNWNAERIIQALEVFFGSGCNPDLSNGGSCDGWTIEQWRQGMADRVCLEGWFFTDNDWLCHSTPQH